MPCVALFMTMKRELDKQASLILQSSAKRQADEHEL